MRFFKIVHFASLDVVIGVVMLHAMIYHVLISQWPAWEYDLLLANSVFLIYGIDRQIDNYSQRTRDELHIFHAQYRLFLIGFMVIAMLINVLLLFRIGLNIICLGIALLLVLGVYWLAWIKEVFGQFWGLKELITAMIYCLGVFLTAGVFSGLSWLWLQLFMALYLLVVFNLYLFTWIEQGGKCIYVQWVALVSGAWLIGLVFLRVNPLLVSLLSLTWGIHVWIYYFRAHVQMRSLGELAFFSPLIYILCNF